jgi:hypothetical protein
LIYASGCTLSAGRAVSQGEKYVKCCSCVCKKILPKKVSSSHALREEYSGCWHAAPSRSLAPSALINFINNGYLQKLSKNHHLLERSQNKKRLIPHDVMGIRRFYVKLLRFTVNCVFL